MRRRFWAGPMRTSRAVCLAAAVIFCAGAHDANALSSSEAMEAARRAYTLGEYTKAAQILLPASQAEPSNGEIHLLLAKTYYEMEERDLAVASAEKAVATDPKSSVYHEWLGRTYGEKAGHSGWFSALSLAKKSRKE